MYDVALLIERELQALDIEQIMSLHEGLADEHVRYHVLLPVESEASAYLASMATLGGYGAPDPETMTIVHDSIVGAGQTEVDSSVALFTERGADAVGRLSEDDPVDAIEALVKEVGAAEVIVLTEPHFISEFFHADWASRAERRLDVPTLHLLEHVPLDAQA